MTITAIDQIQVRLARGEETGLDPPLAAVGG
jgi:hypothetical protein